nr:MAG TPA: hypothetical protein [Caudoviricetes sp.]
MQKVLQLRSLIMFLLIEVLKIHLVMYGKIV